MVIVGGCTRQYFVECMLLLPVLHLRSGGGGAGVPGGLVGGLRTYQDQFRGFKYHRVHARGLFLQKRN